MDSHAFAPRDRPRGRRNNYARNNPDVLLPTPLILRPGQLPHRTLWEPDRQYPRAPRRAPPIQSKPQPQVPLKLQPQTRQLPLQQPRPTLEQHPHPPPSQQKPTTLPPPTPLDESTAHFLAAARKARISAYLSTWDATFAAASALPSHSDTPDISTLTLPTPPAPTAPEKPPHSTPVKPHSASTDGGVTLHSPEQEERPRPTPTSQLSELKAKIPWLAAQRTIHGAGWRPLDEYYWGEDVP